MLTLLFVIMAGLAGVLGMTVFGGFNLHSVPNLPAAGSVLGILVVLYLATLLRHRGERRLALWPTLAACIAGAVLVAGAFNKTSPVALADLFAMARPAEEGAAVVQAESGSVRVRRRDDGGFIANAEVNGAPVSLRIDSGAATVVLKQSDAENAQIDVSHLTYDTPLKTANGMAYLAPVRLKSVRIGPLIMDDVEGLVAQAGTLNESLLGTSFLRRLSSYEVAGNFATLRQ